MLISAPNDAFLRAAAVGRRTPWSTSSEAANASRKPTRGAGDSAAPRGLTSASNASSSVTLVRVTTEEPFCRNRRSGAVGISA